MPSVSATRKKRRSRRKRLSAIRIQVHFLIRKPPGATLTREFLLEVFEEWIRYGVTPENITLVYIEWDNKGRGGSNEWPNENEIEESRQKLLFVLAASDKTIEGRKTDHLHLKDSV